MAEDPFLPFMEEVSEIGDELKEAYVEVDDLKGSGNWTLPPLPHWVLDNIVSRESEARLMARAQQMSVWFKTMGSLYVPERSATDVIAELQNPVLLIGERTPSDFTLIWKVLVDAIASVTLLSVTLYLIGYIYKGGSLDFRDIYIYISILLFQAAYVWIKFRDVIPRGAVYYRPNSNKFEPRIKFPVTRGVGVKSKRIPLGLYDTFVEGEVAYQIAAFYCDKPKHTGQLDLGGGASFSIPALSVDPNLRYEEKVKQVANQVLKVYAEFEERKASTIVPPSVPRLTFETSIGEGQLLATSPIQQLRQPLNSGMDSAMQCQGSQLGPNIHNGIDFNNLGCFLPVLAKTQYELLDAHKENEYLKAQVSQTEVENMGWEVKYSELERKYLELEQKISEVERENGLLNHQIMQSQLQTLHQEQEFDTNIFLSMGHEESLARCGSFVDGF